MKKMIEAQAKKEIDERQREQDQKFINEEKEKIKTKLRRESEDQGKRQDDLKKQAEEQARKEFELEKLKEQNRATSLSSNQTKPVVANPNSQGQATV